MPGKKKKASGDAAKGEKIFKNLCAVCHSLSADSVGPALGGIGGSNIASGGSTANWRKFLLLLSTIIQSNMEVVSRKS